MTDNQQQTRSVHLVLDTDVPRDHVGKPVAPLTPAGLPYRYRYRLSDRAYYASTADDLLSVIIDTYPAPPCDAATDDQLDAYDGDAHDTRVRHAFGVIINHVADAILHGDLSEDREATLRRSAERGADHPPITVEDCPTWDCSIPMLLIAGLYHPSQRRTPPGGNVIFLDPGTAERYLDDLARIGEINLQHNPTYPTGAPATIVQDETPPATESGRQEE